MSERNMGRNFMKSSPWGRCLTSGVRGLQRMQPGSVTSRNVGGAKEKRMGLQISL